MTTPAIRLGCNTNSFIPMYDVFDAVNIINDCGIKWLEISAERELTSMMWGARKENFKDRYQRLKKLIDENNQQVVATCSWVRDNSWVTDDNREVGLAALDILCSLIDMARTLKAPRMMSPFGTIRGAPDKNDIEINSAVNFGIQIWNMARTIAGKESADYGAPLEAIEIEQMSYKLDPPSTIEQARYILKGLEEVYQENSIDAATKYALPVYLRYDVGHAPSPKESDNPDDFTIEGWLGAFPNEIVAFHLKGYLDDDVRTVIPMAGEYEDRGREITYDLLKAIENINDSRSEPIEAVDIIVEGLLLKERYDKHRELLQLTIESVENVSGFLRDKGYREGDDGLWRKVG